MSFEGTPRKTSTKGSGIQASVVASGGKGSRVTVYVVLSTQSMKRTRPTGEVDPSTSYTMEVCRATPKGLYVDANFQVEGHEDDSVDVGNTVMEMKLPCAPGTSWRVGRMSFKDGYVLKPLSRAVAYEPMDVPAGKFANCLKVESTCPNGIEGFVEQDGERLEILSSESTFTTWYSTAVGIVKEVSYSMLRLRPEGEEDAAVLNMTTTTTTELTEYQPGQKEKK
jgi:hypothetical protein